MIPLKNDTKLSQIKDHQAPRHLVATQITAEPILELFQRVFKGGGPLFQRK